MLFVYSQFQHFLPNLFSHTILQTVHNHSHSRGRGQIRPVITGLGNYNMISSTWATGTESGFIELWRDAEKRWVRFQRLLLYLLTTDSDSILFIKLWPKLSAGAFQKPRAQQQRQENLGNIEEDQVNLEGPPPPDVQPGKGWEGGGGGGQSSQDSNR